MTEKNFKLGKILNEKEYVLRSVEFKKYIEMFLTTDLTRPQIELFLFSLIYCPNDVDILIEEYHLQDKDFVKDYVTLFKEVKAEALKSGISETDLKCFMHANINENLLFAFL